MHRMPEGSSQNTKVNDMSNPEQPTVLDLSDEGTISTTAPGYILLAIVVLALVVLGVLIWYLNPRVNNDSEYRNWTKTEQTIQSVEDHVLDLQQNNAMLRNWSWYLSNRAKRLREDGIEYCDGYYWLPENVGLHGKTAHITCTLLMSATRPVGTIKLTTTAPRTKNSSRSQLPSHAVKEI